jgi:hypothetical protein
VRSLAAIEAALDTPAPLTSAQLLAASEEIVEHWIAARGEVPTNASSEGFRLLALHRQGARDIPSFNACRETCREIAYHFNLLQHAASQETARMMTMLVKHLALFVRGKLEVEGLGDFCCASRPLRLESGGERPSEGAHRG